MRIFQTAVVVLLFVAISLLPKCEGDKISFTEYGYEIESPHFVKEVYFVKQSKVGIEKIGENYYYYTPQSVVIFRKK